MLSSVDLFFDDDEDCIETDLRLQRRNLRNKSNLFEISDDEFIRNFRLNKEVFKYVLDAIEDNLRQTYRSTAIPPIMKLAVCLRFFAEGNYQFGIGNDYRSCMAQSTVSTILSECLPILESKICSEWIKMQSGENEEYMTKQNFLDKTGIPGIVGCVDGTHVKIMPPPLNKRHLYYNRKGFYSINAMLICDDKLIIKYVDARHPGANHDSFIWRTSKCNEYLKKKYDEGMRNTWLLGDSGYPLLPYLITPFRSTDEGSCKELFNKMHAKGRNCVERTIGVLKNRFRCIIGERGLHYTPNKVTQIINVCCALHNMCRFYKINDSDFEINSDENVNAVENVSQDENVNASQEAINIRNTLLNIFRT